MISTSDAYKTAINALENYIVPLVYVYFDGDTSAPTEFTGTSIVKINFTEEAKSESGTAGNPFGEVSSNEITISFDNSNYDFTPTNASGAYYGKLRPNLLVRVYLGVEKTAGVYEYVPLGVFRTSDWETPSQAVEATVTCSDKLYEIGDRDVPMLPAVTNTTVYAMFETLFTALGLSSLEYEIDISLNQAISIGWYPKGKVIDALQSLAIAGNCNVMASRYGTIRVRNNFKTGNAVATWTDSNQIITAGNPQRFLDTYNAVKVNYKLPYLKAESSLLKVESLTVPQGGLTLDEITFTTTPVAAVTQVKLTGATNVAVSTMEYGAHAISIALTNTGAAESVTLEVLGQAVDMISTTYTAEDAALIALWGRREISIDNDLIQTKNVAQLYAISLLQYMKDPSNNFSLNIRGDPSLEVNDIIQIDDDTDKIGTINIVPIRFNLDYDGGLSATVEARKPIVPYDWCFVSPGLMIHAVRTITEAADEYYFISPGLYGKRR